MTIPANLPKWISFDGTLGDFGAIVPQLEAWVGLAQHWRDIGGAIWKLGQGAPVDSPVRLALYLADHIGDAEVVEIFGELGLADLHGKVAALGAKLEDPANPWHKLLQPMSDFAEAEPGEAGDGGFGFDAKGEDGEFSLQIPKVAPSAATSLGPAALTFDLGLEAGIECEAGSPWPFRSDNVSGGMLRLGGSGKVKTKAGISLPFGQIGSGTAHAGAECEAAVSYFFRPGAPDNPYAEVLLKSVTSLPSPLDLEGISHAMALAGMEGMALGCGGAVEAGLGLVIGQQFEIAKLASGTLGLTADISFKRNAQWILSLRKTALGMRFVLSRDDKRERHWAAGLDLKLDASPLAQKVHDLLIEAKDFTGPALEKIKPFLSPGTYLATKSAALLKTTAASIIGQADLRDALVKDLSLALGDGKADTSALTALLTDKLIKHAAAASGGVLAETEAWTDGLVDGLVREVPALAGVGLDAELKARIKPLLSDVKTAFDNEVRSLVSNTSFSAGLAKELSAIGASIKAAERDADKLLAGVREVIEKFQAFSDKVLKATEDAASSKLQARFGWSGDDSNGLKYELSGTFTQSTPETSELWRSLVTGKLQTFQRMLADPALVPAGLQLAPESSLSRFTSRERGFSAEFVIFGIDLSISSIVKGEATITTSASGDLAVTAKGSALRRIEGFDEGRTATFISSWDLLMAKADAAEGRRHNMAIEVGLDHADKNLKSSEVEGMLKGLRDLKLIDPSRVDNALAVYQDWQVKGAPGGKVKGRIGVRMQVPDIAVSNMIALGRDVIRRSQKTLLSTFDLAVRAQLAAGVASRKQFDRDIDAARQTFTISAKTDDPNAYMLALSNSKIRLLPSQGEGPQLPALAQIIPRAAAYQSLMAAMTQIFDAVPSDGSGLPGTWSEKEYAEAEKRMASAARNWLKLNADFIFWFKPSLHPALLAFFRLLTTMSQPMPDGPSGLLGSDDASLTVIGNSLIRITMTSDGDGQTIPI